MINKSTMPSGHSMKISTSILGCRNADYMSHSPETHNASSWYRVIPIRILVDVSDANCENYSVKSTPGTCMYPLTTFLDFGWINPSGSYLLLNNQFTGTDFLPFAFTTLLFVRIHIFLDRKLLTSEIADIFYKFPFGLANRFLEGLRFFNARRNRRTACPMYFVLFVFHDQNDSSVSSHFIFSLDDWLLHPWHNWVVQNI